MECIDINSTQIHNRFFRLLKDSADESRVRRTVSREVPFFNRWWRKLILGKVPSHCGMSKLMTKPRERESLVVVFERWVM